MTKEVENFGRGLLCPVQRDGKGDFANSAGLSVLKSDVGECIGIIGPIGNSPGELPWDGDRGSNHRPGQQIVLRNPLVEPALAVLERPHPAYYLPVGDNQQALICSRRGCAGGPSAANANHSASSHAVHPPFEA